MGKFKIRITDTETKISRLSLRSFLNEQDARKECEMLANLPKMDPETHRHYLKKVFTVEKVR